MLTVTVTVISFKNIVAYRKKCIKPSLGNSNVHRRTNLERERSALEIVSYRARVKNMPVAIFTVRVLLTIENGGIP